MSNLERAFELIKLGKTQTSEGQHWDAADSFLEARTLLQKLAQDHPSENEEGQKIAKLYLDQSVEYFHRSRESLVAALQDEHKKDLSGEEESNEEEKKQQQHEPSYTCQSISEEEAKRRIQIFTSVFAKQVEVVPDLDIPAVGTTSKTADNSSKNVHDKQLSLEERLAELNAHLPKGIKSSDERLQDVTQGMKRLGLVVCAGSSYHANKIEPPKSESQQVQDIIAQAKDEVAMRAALGDSGGAADTSDNLDDDDDEILLSDDDDYDEADSLLSDEEAELQNVSKIREEVAATQAKLAELLASMECLSSEEDDDNDDGGDGKDPNSSFDPIGGKQVLKQANESLRKAMKLWKVKARQATD